MVISLPCFGVTAGIKRLNDNCSGKHTKRKPQHWRAFQGIFVPRSAPVLHPFR